jgi:hypothetical protein
LYIAWRTQSILALEELLGSDHVYTKSFDDEVSSTTVHSHYVKIGRALLEVIYQDITEGFLRKLETLISAEIFSDFLEMANHLFDNGYKDPAASLCGAVLEDGLRKIAGSNGIKVQANDNLNSLNTKCAQAKIYNDLARKQVIVWTGIRNYADHGQFDQYTVDNVREMLQGVRIFLSSYLK